MTEDLRETLNHSDELTGAGRHEEHLALMREALARHPGELEVVIRAAEAHMVEGPEEAAELAREAVKMAPDDPVTLTRAASVMFYVERLEEARKLLIRAMEGAPDDFILASDLVYLGGQIFFAYGNHDKAEEFLTLAFDDQPERPGRGYALSDLLEHQGEFARALEVADEALRHRPGDGALEDLQARLRFLVYAVEALPPGYAVRYK